jgi:hypothetical protein
MHWANQRLVFWRLLFRDYNRVEVARALEELMEAVGAGAWTLYEMYGPFDLLLRLWLPPDVPNADFNRALVEKFSTSLDICDQFAVDEVVTHWPWVGPAGMREPDLRPSVDLPIERLDELEGEERTALLDELRRRDILAEIREGAGIAFMIAVTPSRPGLVSSQRGDQAVADRIADLFDSAPPVFSERSLYRGAGFASYLLQARVLADAFSALQQFIAGPLNESLQALGYRAYTSLMTGPHSVANVSSSPAIPTHRDKPTIRESLERGEGPTLEVRGFAFSGISDTGMSGGRSASAEALAKAVTGFLNTEGGTVVLGACEKKAVQGNSRLADQYDLAGAPTVGAYVIPGIDHELDKGVDMLLRRIRDLCASSIEPDPSGFIRLEIEEVEGRAVCSVEIRAPRSVHGGPWFYFAPRSGRQAHFFVRAGAMTKELNGPAADMYKTGGKTAMGAMPRVSV